jgi:hypothetical protein
MSENVTPLPTIDAAAAEAIRTASWGFRIVAVLLAIGMVISAFRKEALPSGLGSFSTVLGNVLDFEGAGFIGLAIALMILTPVAVTLTVALAFLRSGERRYGTLTLVVLTILVVSVGLSQW